MAVVQRMVTKTVTTSQTTWTGTEAATFDAAMTTAMDAVISSPPTGYIPDSMRIQPFNLTWDGTNFKATQQFCFITQI